MRAQINPETGVVRILDAKGHPITAYAGYSGIASVKVGNTEYFAVSHYYAGAFPVGQVFTIQAVPGSCYCGTQDPETGVCFGGHDNES